MRYFFLLLYAAALWGGAAPTDMTPYGVDKHHYMKIRILDQLSLSYPNIDGHHFFGISDLAYDRKKNRLYLLGDQRGKIFIFNAEFGEKIENFKPLSAFKLVGRGGKAFRSWRSDSEGMTLDRSGKLLISFEGRSKIGRFSTKGVMLKEYRLPPKLLNVKNYRSRNKSLESVVQHPKYGILTAAEWPLKRDKAKDQTIYSLSGKEWHFKADSATSSAVVSMEVMDDGNLLVLERAYSGLRNPVVVTLKKVWLRGCKRKGKKRKCRSEVLARFSNTDGWGIDNFEGLTKVGKNRYVMVSDDNDNFFQRTLLVYFEVIE
ncbi:MAG: esterase-like activity of phytase family protein [Campylobacterota bacterium]|nr:esterase-like activity of phytase family protein [Campylobacterota bacterium]